MNKYFQDFWKQVEKENVKKVRVSRKFSKADKVKYFKIKKELEKLDGEFNEKIV